MLFQNKDYVTRKPFSVDNSLKTVEKASFLGRDKDKHPGESFSLAIFTAYIWGYKI